MDKLLGGLLPPMGVDSFGVCAFGDCLPLLPCRAASRLPEAARSVIVCLFPYYTGEFPRRNVARYAVLPDYHAVAGKILEKLVQQLRTACPGEGFAAFVDNSPLREVSAAVLAGLGVAGRHGQLIHPRYGSRALIGAVVTTMDIAPSAPAAGSCLECGRCRAACPTGALEIGGGINKGRCRSHITQKKGELTPWEREQVAAGGLVWGCDLCADACPMNRDEKTPIPAFYDNPAPFVTGDNLEGLIAQKSYGYRGKAVLLRNIAIIITGVDTPWRY